MTRLYVCDRIVTTMLNDNTRYHPEQWRSEGIRIVNKYKGCMKVDKYEYQAKLEEMKKLVIKKNMKRQLPLQIPLNGRESEVYVPFVW